MKRTAAILTATIGLLTLTSACTPAQVKQFLNATKRAPAVKVVAVDEPPVPEDNGQAPAIVGHSTTATVVEIGTPEFPTLAVTVPGKAPSACPGGSDCPPDTSPRVEADLSDCSQAALARGACHESPGSSGSLITSWS